jgi:hypothetical protein
MRFFSGRLEPQYSGFHAPPVYRQPFESILLSGHLIRAIGRFGFKSQISDLKLSVVRGS